MSHRVRSAVAAALIGIAGISTGYAEVQMTTEVFLDAPESIELAGLMPAQQQFAAPSGTPVRYVIVYTNADPEPTEITITNQLPKDLLYVASYDQTGDSMVEVSVDGGRTFGLLGSLSIPTSSGRRPARFEDVTTVRWMPLGLVEPGKSGLLNLKAVVR